MQITFKMADFQSF